MLLTRERDGFERPAHLLTRERDGFGAGIIVRPTLAPRYNEILDAFPLLIEQPELFTLFTLFFTVCQGGEIYE